MLLFKPLTGLSTNSDLYIYWDWYLDKAAQFYLGGEITRQFLASFLEYPPSQRPDSWSLDRFQLMLEQRMRAAQQQAN